MSTTTETSPTAIEPATPSHPPPSGIQDHRQASDRPLPIPPLPAGTTLPAGQVGLDTHATDASGDQTTQPTSVAPLTKGDASAGSDSRSGQDGDETESPLAAAGLHFPDGHQTRDRQYAGAVGETNPPAPAIPDASPKRDTPVLAPDPRADQYTDDVHNDLVGTGQTPPAITSGTSPKEGSSLADPFLALLADALDDLERTRIANENRLRQLTRAEEDSDGEERGFGLTLDQPQVAALANVVEALGRLEHESTLNLQRRLRKHPLGPWVKAQKGIGEKQAARLLAAIGDPYWNTLHDRPRLVSELWQYAGHGDPARSRRRRGQRVQYSPTAKMRLHLIAKSCMKNLDSPYRAVYETRKARTEGRLHATECVRCGPSGKPAAIGTPWSDGHRHADALRITGKAILRDLWLEARRIHGPAPPTPAAGVLRPAPTDTTHDHDAPEEG